MEKIITIKSEDKAAFLNRMKKAGHPIDTFQELPKVEGEYSIKVTDSDELMTIQDILNQSPKIEQIKRSSTKYSKLKEYIRKEIHEALRYSK
jgi:hypothetical protein